MDKDLNELLEIIGSESKDHGLRFIGAFKHNQDIPRRDKIRKGDFFYSISERSFYVITSASSESTSDGSIIYGTMKVEKFEIKRDDIEWGWGLSKSNPKIPSFQRKLR